MKAIAIDGPSGAGKSTLAQKLSQELGFRYVDTGAIYRTVALGLLRRELSLDTVATTHLDAMNISISYAPTGEQIMLLSGVDVSADIRKNEISILTSKVAALPCVRAFLLQMQRTVVTNFDVVMDGRDIGTVVLPDAAVKIFLTASPEARAKRRANELSARGEIVPFETILEEIVKRDHQDSTRAISPLKQASDATLLDTTNLNLEQSLQALLNISKEGLNAHA